MPTYLQRIKKWDSDLKIVPVLINKDKGLGRVKLDNKNDVKEIEKIIGLKTYYLDLFRDDVQVQFYKVLEENLVI